MKERFHIEYPMRSTSLNVLWSYIGSANGLASWFADSVMVSDRIFTFTWDGSEQKAELQNIRVGHYIRFHWLEDEGEKTYFEFKITINELTAEVELLITDFANEGEKPDLVALWNKQIDNLRRVVGVA